MATPGSLEPESFMIYASLRAEYLSSSPESTIGTMIAVSEAALAQCRTLPSKHLGRILALAYPHTITRLFDYHSVSRAVQLRRTFALHPFDFTCIRLSSILPHSASDAIYIRLERLAHGIPHATKHFRMQWVPGIYHWI